MIEAFFLHETQDQLDLFQETAVILSHSKHLVRFFMRKPTFLYTDSAVPLLSESEISSLWLSSVAVQAGLCRTWSETTTLVFSFRGPFQ